MLKSILRDGSLNGGTPWYTAHLILEALEQELRHNHKDPLTTVINEYFDTLINAAPLNLINISAKNVTPQSMTPLKKHVVNIEGEANSIQDTLKLQKLHGAALAKALGRTHRKFFFHFDGEDKMMTQEVRDDGFLELPPLLIFNQDRGSDEKNPLRQLDAPEEITVEDSVRRKKYILVSKVEALGSTGNHFVGVIHTKEGWVEVNDMDPNVITQRTKASVTQQCNGRYPVMMLYELVETSEREESK